MLKSLRNRAGGLAHRLNLLRKPSAPVCLVADGWDWALDQVAQAMADAINARHPEAACVVDSVAHLRNRVVHFMSRNLWLGRAGGLHDSNRVVVTSLHGVPEDGPGLAGEIRNFIERASEIDRITTSNRLLFERLLSWGIAPGKLAIVPLGVDGRLFRPAAPEARRLAKETMGLPLGLPCIGSFQKDGDGWGEGMSPKLVKGPDIFLGALERLCERRRFCVLLTGPARGYVKSGLERLGIEYRHVMADGLEDIARCYHALDLYVIGSRDEGGPLGLVQSLASGVPIVATRCGMVPDAIRHGENGFIAENMSPAALGEYAEEILGNPQLALRFGQQGLESARLFDWKKIADDSWEEVYRPLIRSYA